MLIFSNRYFLLVAFFVDGSLFIFHFIPTIHTRHFISNASISLLSSLVLVNVSDAYKVKLMQVAWPIKTYDICDCHREALKFLLHSNVYAFVVNLGYIFYNILQLQVLRCKDKGHMRVFINIFNRYYEISNSNNGDIPSGSLYECDWHQLFSLIRFVSAVQLFYNLSGQKAKIW